MPIVMLGWTIRAVGVFVWLIAFAQLIYLHHITGASSEIDKLTFVAVVVPMLFVLPGYFTAWKFLLAYSMATVGAFMVVFVAHGPFLGMLGYWLVWTLLLSGHPQIYPVLFGDDAEEQESGAKGTPAQPMGAAAQPKAPVGAPTPAAAKTQAPQGNQNQRPQPQPPTPAYDFADCMSKPRYKYADVVGMAETKQRLLAAAKDVIAARANPRNGILLFGEPGNGKTMFAEALAGELKVPFFAIAYGDIGSMWVGEPVQKIKAAFAAARRIGFGVFFIDEFDSFIKERSGPGSHHMDRDLTNTMLTEIVNLRGTKIVLVAATNHLDDLDGAGIREKRFDFKVEVPAPDQEARQAILRRAIGNSVGYEAADTEVVATLAARWAGYSAARLTAVGEQIGDMRRSGEFAGKLTFEIGMRALRLIQGRKGKLPETVKAIDEILMPDMSRNALKDLAFKMSNVYSLEQIGGRLPTGLIFTGPPGTGKTQAAMALAKQADWAFLKITGAEIAARPEAWDKLYRTACDIRPVVMFLDEADGILRDRQYSGYGMLTEKILTTIDGAGGRVRDVLFVAATNHFDRVDTAAVRGGRFEEKIVFDVPKAEDMQTYIRAKLASLSGWAVGVSVESRLFSNLQGASVADADAVIQKAIDAAAVRRLRDNTNDIRAEDVDQAASSVLRAPGGSA
ncbi:MULTISPECIES: AAA family ATPase [unclassified Paraburkholderia]|uniref:AAA family ATPase n=1 Tax=unclassified Paraburkholderia TaxID=2615204 RepID=UPI002AAF1012|nr:MULTISPECIES: AAA family ATPase [unclassified Paraburkholderia]